MSPHLKLLTLAAAAGLAITPASAATPHATGDLVAAAAGSQDHRTLVAALKAAGLVETLGGEGPFTVFAPTDSAFGKLPAGTVDTLLRPENVTQLRAVLTYHVVPGKVTAAELVEAIRQGGGQAMLKTVQGGMLTARLSGANVVIADATGGLATVTQADIVSSNGVIHVTNSVSLPG
jgi:uncharacterized surface protein with fasciclin (FAS1) repeats